MLQYAKCREIASYTAFTNKFDASSGYGVTQTAGGVIARNVSGQYIDKLDNIPG